VISFNDISSRLQTELKKKTSFFDLNVIRWLRLLMLSLLVTFSPAVAPPLHSTTSMLKQRRQRSNSVLHIHATTFHPFQVTLVYTSLLVPLAFFCLLFCVPNDFLPFTTVLFTNNAVFTFYSMFLVRLYPIHIYYYHGYHSYQDSLFPSC
jgi:hypothetical protein